MSKNKKIRIVVLFFIIISLVITLFVKWMEFCLFPRGAEVLHSYAETNMFEILNSTISEVIEKYSIKYEDIVEIKYDKFGVISSINVDYGLVNRIKSEISMIISEKLSNQDEIPVYVPVGDFSKNMYFIGKGPRIKFILVQRGVVNTDLVHSFQSAGINQTMHTIEVSVDADVALMIPFYNTHTFMKTTAILSQTIINGQCPDGYLNLYKGEMMGDR